MNAQQLIIGHLLPIAGGLMLLWIAYRLLFNNSNRVRFNRFFLLTAMLFSLVLPLIGLLMGEASPQIVHLKQNIFNGIMLSEVTITPDGAPIIMEESATVETMAQPKLSIWQIIGTIYLIGVGVMTLLFLIKLIKLVVITIRSPKEKREGYTTVFTGRDQGSFSFFHYAFFPN